MYYFTADEHYYHKNIIKYCDRPFESLDEMHYELITRFNSMVKKDDITIHAGDFALTKPDLVNNVIKQLNGNHIFLKGSHDRWLKGRSVNQIWEKRIDGILVIICHYCMRTWAASHYNSFHLYGHSHGKLEPIGKSWDIGVDNNNFYPLSWDDIKDIMKERPDNPNLIKGKY
jgi:calcineurin-like phosphoesterase family protein